MARIAESREEVALPQPGPHAPEHGLKKQPIVLRRHPPVPGLTRQMRRKSLPQNIRNHKTLPAHSNPPLGTLNQTPTKIEILIDHGTWETLKH